MFRLTCICLVWSLGLLRIGFSSADEFAPTSGNIHVLLVVDTNADYDRNQDGRNDWGFAVSLNRMRSLLSSLPEEEASKVKLHVLQGDNASPDSIRRYYATLRSNPEDVLFFYYMGHGEVSDRFTERDRELSIGVPTERSNPKYHHLTLKAGGIRRLEIRNLMLSQPSRLCVLFADCCSSFAGGVEDEFFGNRNAVLHEAALLTERVRGVTILPGTSHPPRCHPRLWKKLMREHMGFVDIGGAPIGFFGFAGQDLGGFSSYVFTEVMSASDEYLSTCRMGPSDRPANWMLLISDVFQPQYRLAFFQQRTIKGRKMEDSDLDDYNGIGPTQFVDNSSFEVTHRFGRLANSNVVVGYGGNAGVMCRVNPDVNGLNGYYNIIQCDGLFLTVYSAEKVFNSVHLRRANSIHVWPIELPSKTPWDRQGTTLKIR